MPTSIPARLTFICGHSGAGKSTLSKALVRRLNDATREVKSRKVFDAAAMGLDAGTRISVVWVTVAETVARQRIEQRGERRDRYKLTHWDEYRARRFEPVPGEYPGMLLFDNTLYSEVRTLEIARAILSPGPAAVPL